MPRIWTEEEIKILLNAKNKKRIEIPRRSEKSVHRKMIMLGLIKPKYKARKHSKRRWTNEELKILYESKDKLNIKLPGRTRNSILAKLGNLNLIKRQKAKRPWPKTHEKLLLKLHKEGKTSKEIFLSGSLPYSKNSIQKKICYLGLAKKQKGAEYFPKKIIEDFKKFLMDNWQGNTPEDLVNLWNEKNINKVKKTKVIYHLTKLKIKISYVEVTRIKFIRKKEENFKKLNLSLKCLSDSVRLTRVDMMQKRMLKNRDIWTGLPVPEEDLIDLEL
jgi:hypothetical protein